MSRQHDKIVEAQVMAQDSVAHISAMLNQESLEPEKLEKLRERLEQLSQLLNSIDEKG